MAALGANGAGGTRPEADVSAHSLIFVPRNVRRDSTPASAGVYATGTVPPSTTYSSPVMDAARGDTRNSTSSEASFGFVGGPFGIPPLTPWASFALRRCSLCHCLWLSINGCLPQSSQELRAYDSGTVMRPQRGQRRASTASFPPSADCHLWVWPQRRTWEPA